MNVQLIFYNTFSNRSYFELTAGKRPWNVFLILAEGSFRFQANGEEFTVGKNEIAYFPLNLSFTRSVTEPITFHQFGFTCDHSHPYLKSLKCGKLGLPPAHVRAMIDNLEALSGYEQHEQELFIRAIENIIIENHIFRPRDSGTLVTQSEDINEAIRYMKEHLSEKISIEELADSIHLSHVGFLWKFKRCMGTTPSQFLSWLRMQTAKQLLLEGGYRINEIAALCGYSNPYYFSNAFKNFYHVSPGKYRKLMLDEP